MKLKLIAQIVCLYLCLSPDFAQTFESTFDTITSVAMVSMDPGAQISSVSQIWMFGSIFKDSYKSITGLSADISLRTFDTEAPNPSAIRAYANVRYRGYTPEARVSISEALVALNEVQHKLKLAMIDHSLTDQQVLIYARERGKALEQGWKLEHALGSALVERANAHRMQDIVADYYIMNRQMVDLMHEASETEAENVKAENEVKIQHLDKKIKELDVSLVRTAEAVSSPIVSDASAVIPLNTFWAYMQRIGQPRPNLKIQ